MDLAKKDMIDVLVGAVLYGVRVVLTISTTAFIGGLAASVSSFPCLLLLDWLGAVPVVFSIGSTVGTLFGLLKILTEDDL